MNEAEDPVARQSTRREPRADLLEQYGCGPIQFTGTKTRFTSGTFYSTMWSIPATPSPRDRYEAAPLGPRRPLAALAAHRATLRTGNPKRIYYLSMEFLIGRSLATMSSTFSSTRLRSAS